VQVQVQVQVLEQVQVQEQVLVQELVQEPYIHKRHLYMLHWFRLHQDTNLHYKFHICNIHNSLFHRKSNHNQLGLNTNTDRTVFWPLHHKHRSLVGKMVERMVGNKDCG
jgi:hypothetical protein